jgi:hypothetical protein
MPSVVAREELSAGAEATVDFCGYSIVQYEAVRRGISMPKREGLT